MCRLQLLDLRGNSRLFKQERCRCQTLITWLKNRHGETFQLFPSFNSFCENTTEGTVDLKDPDFCFDNETRLLLEESDLIAKACETEVMKYGSGPLRLKGSMTWTLAIVGVCLILLLCFASLYCLRKKQLARPPSKRQEVEESKDWST